MTKLGLVTKIYPRIIVSVCAILAIACGNILTKIDKETELQFPILSLRQASETIRAGGSIDAGSTLVGQAMVLLFSIDNPGKAEVRLSGSPLVSLVGGLDFTITEYPNPIIQAGGSTTFKLEFIPSTGGAASVRIDIASNDPKTPVHSITVTAHGTLDPRPQLEVKRDLGGALAISAGSQVNLGYSVPDIPQDFPFIIRNAGASQALFATVATNAPQFSILAQPVSPIASGAISSFILRFIVAANDTNLYSTEVTVTCNDPDYAAIPYVFTAKCQGSNAKMQVKDGATSLSPVGATPATLALGSVSVGSNLSRSLSVANGGTGDMHLILSPAARFSGGDAGLFSISAQPAETITSGTPSSLTLKFEPLTYGSFSVTLSIPNTSGDFPDYALTVTGTGLAPDLKLALGGTPIARDGAAPPWPDTNYLTQSEATFTIQNVGNSALTLGGGAVSLSGTDASKFVITQQPPSSIAASSSGVFKIAFAPTTLGSKSAIATISSNDPGKPSFAFSLSGIGKAPMVALSSGSGPIASGSTLAFPEAIYKRSQSNATITVSNSGTLPLSVTAIALDGTNASDFNLTASLPMNIAAGSSTTFSLALKTDTVGIKSAGVTLTTNDPSTPSPSFSLSSAVRRPTVELWQGASKLSSSGATYSFGSQLFKTSSGPLTLTIRNSGDSALNLGSPAVVATGSTGDFSLTQPATSSIAAGGSATFSIVFAPQSFGGKSLSIAIASDDYDLPSFPMTLSGTGTAPLIVVKLGSDIANGGSYDFGDVGIASSADRVFTVDNRGSYELVLGGSPTVSGTDAAMFSVVSWPAAGAARTIAPGGSTTFTLRLTPTAIRAVSAGISFTSSDDGSTSGRNPYTISLAGRGTGPIMTVLETAKGGTFGFGNCNIGGEYLDRSFTIRNDGNTTLSLTGSPAVSVSGSGFSVQAQPGSTSLAAGTSTTFTLRFAPSSQGSAAGSIGISNNDSDALSNNNPYSFSLTGFGTKPGFALRDQYNNALPKNGSLDCGWGGTTLNPFVNFTLTNNGDGPLIMGSIVFGGANASMFSVYTSPPYSLAAGASASIAIRFIPTGAIGARTATMSISTNDPSTGTYVLNLNAEMAGMYSSLCSPYDLAVSGSYAYTDALSYGTMYVLNISNPVSPSKTGQYYPDGNPINGIALSGSYAYIGNSKNLRVVDLTTLATPTIKYTVSCGFAAGSSYVCNDLAISGSTCYVAGKYGGLKAFDISGMPGAAPVLKATYSLANLSVNGVVAPGDGYIYAATSGLASAGLEIFTFNGTTLTSVGKIQGLNANKVFVSGNYAYLAAYEGIKIINVSTRASPTVASTPTATNGMATFVTGSTLFASAGNSTVGYYVLIYNVANPAAPVLSKSYRTYGVLPNDLWANGTYLHAACGSDGYVILQY